MRRAGYLLPTGFAVCLTLGAIAAFLSGPLTAGAVQNPRISLEMDPTGNSYDPATNSMTVGTIDSCLASPAANSSTHTHTAHLVIENVENLVGWQARLNYNGDEMRPASVDFDPFLDTATGQEVSFVNLPKDGPGNLHRDLTGGIDIPEAALGRQSALIGSAYRGTENFAVSPDTPAKSYPDDSSYSAPNGGVLAAVDLEVSGDQSGRTLFIQLDDGNPYPPGSRAVVFNGAGITDIDLTSDQLNDGYHAEGGDSCAPVTMPTDAPVTPTPTSGPLTPTPTASPPPPARLLADIQITEISVEVPESAPAGEPIAIRLTGKVMNGGPDGVDVQLLASYGSDSTLNCLPAVDHSMFWNLGHLGPSEVSDLDISNDFTCYGTSGPITSGNFYLGATAYPSTSGAYDPDMENNYWARQTPFSVIGSAPFPTPVPGPPVDPIQEPSTPPPHPPTIVPGSGTSPANGGSAVSGSSGAAASGRPTAAQASIQSPAPAVLAAALPRSGGSGGDFSGWAFLLGGAMGSSSAVAFALGIRHLFSLRYRR